jgi:hypothetical protein
MSAIIYLWVMYASNNGLSIYRHRMPSMADCEHAAKTARRFPVPEDSRTLFVYCAGPKVGMVWDGKDWDWPEGKK